MYQFWVEFTKYVLAVIAMFWMITGIGLMFAANEYPIAAISINAVSLLGICAFNALHASRSKQ